MPVTPGNRLNTAFPVRLLFVFPAIFSQEGDKAEMFPEGRLIDEDKLEFTFIAMVEYLLLNIKLFFHASIG